MTKQFQTIKHTTIESRNENRIFLSNIKTFFTVFKKNSHPSVPNVSLTEPKSYAPIPIMFKIVPGAIYSTMQVIALIPVMISKIDEIQIYHIAKINLLP